MRRLRLVLPVAALSLAGAAGLGACASSEDVEQRTFSTDLIERTGITEDEADCLTEKIYAEFDQSEVNRIYHAATEGEVGGDTLETLDDFNADCITGPAAEDTGSDDDDDATTTTEDDGDATTTTAADDEGSTTTGG